MSNVNVGLNRRAVVLPIATFLMQLGSQETENMERGVEDEETGRDCIESEWDKLSGRG